MTEHIRPSITSAPRRFQRSSDDKWLTGVCGGVADSLGVDANLVRLVAGVAAIFTLGGALLAYILAYVLMAEPDGSPSPARRWSSRN